MPVLLSTAARLADAETDDGIYTSYLADGIVAAQGGMREMIRVRLLVIRTGLADLLLGFPMERGPPKSPQGNGATLQLPQG
jgi:hypothetical protein